ncbi:MAG: asparagine synthase (glutamine-hydrolyzing) [Planctomycetaceae bacterium]
MCGICGAIGANPETLVPAVRRMMRAMPHRGPDDEGFEQMPMGPNSRGAVAAFGFRRLAILDLSMAGHQPMVSPFTDDCLVFNGEIYNYRELRERLASERVQVRSTGDTEVLLKALVHWGDEALEMLDGMYALAFYHARSRRVLLARDPVGIKPLYVSQTDHGLLFASEVRMLRSSELISGELDPAGVASFLTYGAPQDPLTVHRDVRSFPCGSRTWVSLDASGCVTQEPPQRFWRFPAPIPGRSAADAAESLTATLRRTVRDHLASDVPLAFFLSGGIDSAVIATLATEQLGRVSTYSVGFDSPTMPSELPVAAETARLIDSDHHEVILSARTIAATWEEWMLAADRPSVDGLNTYLITKAVKAGNAKVAFSGLGADEIFGGYANFFRVRRLASLLRAMAALPVAIRETVAGMLLPLCPLRYRTRLMMLARSSGRPIDLAVELKQILGSGRLAELGLRSADVGLPDDFLPAELHAELADAGNDPFLAVSRVETYVYMQNTLLRDADTNSMAHSIELRVPFVGRAVLEEAARTPGEVHLAGGRVPKAVLRQAVSGFLAPAVLNRPKTGFSLPVGDWMYDELRDFCEAAIDGLRHIPFIDGVAARRLWNRFEKDRAHTYWMKPLLLVALGNYADNCSRAYVDSAGAMKLRPRRQPESPAVSGG